MSKLVSFGGGFVVYDMEDRQVAEIKGDWKGWNFKFIAVDNVEIGTVTKKWAGIGKELFTAQGPDGVRALAIEERQALQFATQLMGHLGADVVKVEHPERGDSGRGAQPFLTDKDGRKVGATYLRNNLAKRSIGIDLKQPAGAELIRRLVPNFDVIAENFLPGTLDRLGIGYDALRAIQPRLIYASIAGFGQLTDPPYHRSSASAPRPHATP